MDSEVEGKYNTANRSLKVERRIWFFLVILAMVVGPTFVLAFTMYFSQSNNKKRPIKDESIPVGED